MQLHVLGSSSKGNCYILHTPEGSLLLECGMGIYDIKEALSFNLRDVVGCLITHEHQDHSKAILKVIECGIDVLTSLGTIEALDLQPSHRLHIVRDQEPVTLGQFHIIPLKAEHDAAEPLSFLITYKPTGEQLLFATDTYYIRYAFENLTYIMIECNYIPEILKANIEKGTIDERRQRRLLFSHFSLDNVLEFIKANDMSTVKKIILMHLSDDNSDAKRMIKEVEDLSQRSAVVAETGMIIELSKTPF